MVCCLNEGPQPLEAPLHYSMAERKVTGMILLVPMCLRSQFAEPRTDPVLLKVSILLMPQVRWGLSFSWDLGAASA